MINEPNAFEIISELSPGENLRLSGWSGSSPAFVIVQTALKTKRPVIIIASNLKEATLLEQNLSFFASNQVPHFLFPTIDLHPYYSLAHNPDIIMDRLGLLWRFSNDKEPFIAIVPMGALTRRLIPRSFFIKETFTISKGDTLNREELFLKLTHLGYLRSPLVEDQGSFGVRGGTVDLFSPAHPYPCRLDFFDDAVENIRFFDSTTQKSVENVSQIVVIPAREILVDKLDEEWKSQLKKLCDNQSIPKSERDEIQEALSKKIYFNGIETYLPFFYKDPGTLFDYFPNNSFLFFFEEKELFIHLEEELKVQEFNCQKSTSVERIFEPTQIFLTVKDIKEYTSYFPKINIEDVGPPENAIRPDQMETNDSLINLVRGQLNREDALRPLANEINDRRLTDTHIFLIASSLAQRERLSDLLSRYQLPLEIVDKVDDKVRSIQRALSFEPSSPFVQILTGSLTKGFYWPSKKQWWITDHEIFGKKIKRSPSKRAEEIFSSFSELSIGDYVVHEAHGIGIYRGLKNLHINNNPNDFLLLEYLGQDKLYVPVDQLNRISRYGAKEGVTPLCDKMGGASWKKVREKIKRETRHLARELLEIQARRQSEVGFAYSPKNELFEEFEATFPFEETEDQENAINEVISNMEECKPMDRLVCGDVGYGKTEVALRAAFKAALDHKQTAILVPTTVLAFQHFDTFRKRFENYAVNIELLSRFQTTTEQKKIIGRLSKGETDIVIATHRLLSKDVKFRDLGLLVIDEEHRFGVTQKEKIKKLKKLVDVLTLSATPIPRTLNFALVGIRDLSLIHTPPADRLAIRTFVTHFDEATISEAIRHEIKRDGQVFFVHNRVQTIKSMKERLQKILPDISIEIAHGQMPEDELEQVMVDFMEHKFQVLLCTTIIESGLDISRANTIIINRADHMGLAQLYQLRGRVGRSDRRAYCYLLIPHDTLITDVAKKRLRVIQKFTELGSGFRIASHDLEIRGAGNILGPEQSGHIAAVGYDMYVQLLEEAVNQLKGIDTQEEIEPEIKLPISAIIPEEMIPDTQLRLVLYKQLSSVKTDEACLNLREEWMDRFGELPNQTENLILLIRTKLMAKELKITSIQTQKQSLVFQIHASSPIPIDYFLSKIKKDPGQYKILPDGKFVVYEKEAYERDLLDRIRNYLMEMAVS